MNINTNENTNATTVTPNDMVEKFAPEALKEAETVSNNIQQTSQLNNPLVKQDSNSLDFVFDDRKAQCKVGPNEAIITGITLQKNKVTEYGKTNIFNFTCKINTGDPRENLEVKYSLFASYKGAKGFKEWYKNMTGIEIVPKKIDFSQFIGMKVKIIIEHETTAEGDSFDRVVAMYRLDEPVKGTL